MHFEEANIFFVIGDSKEASPFSSMGDITVDTKVVNKLLDRLNIDKAPDPDGLKARVRPVYSYGFCVFSILFGLQNTHYGSLLQNYAHEKVPIFS